jgi:hypothetical protein
MSKDFYSHEATELELYLWNDVGCYRAYLVPTCRALARLYDKGKYTHEVALRRMLYSVNASAKQYNLEHGSMTTKWSSLFPRGDRDRVSAVLVDHFLTELRLGNRFWE